MNFLGLDYILIERVPKISTEGELWLAESPNPEAEGKRVIVKLYNQGIHPEGDIVERLQQVDHDHVVKVHRSNRLPDGRSFQILEYIQHGTLNEIWGDCRWPLSSADDEAPEIKAKRIKLVRELWKAIQGIQEMDLVHGDIKPENVMSRDTDWDLVLTDFGLSSVVEMSLHTASKGQTQAYSSPEALSGIVHKANDWWSMGIVLLEMLRGEHPLLLYISKSSQHRGELVKQLHEHGIEVPSDVDRDWEPLIKGLLTYNSEKRWGAEEVGRWLDGDREMPVHYQAGYGRAVKPIRFGDHDYYSPAQLARAMAERWGDGLVLHQSGQLLDWVLQDLENRHMAARLQTVPNKIKIETSSGHNDLLDDLRYSAVLLALEPKLPVMHRGAGSVGEEITERWLERHDRHIVDAVLDSGLPQVCEDWSGASWLKKAKERRDKVRPFLRQAKDAGIEFHEPGVQAVVFSDLDRVLEQSQTIRRRFSAVRESHPRLDEKEADLTPLQRKKIRKKRGEILTELLQTESLEIHHAVLLRLMATAGTDLFLITWQEHYFILDDSIEKQFNALQTELESFTPESAEYGPAQKRIAALRELLRDAGEQVGRLREAANESERDRFFPSADVLAAAIEARETVEVSLATGLINRIGKVVTKPDLSRTVIEQCEKELDDVAALLAGIEAPGDSGVQDPTAARKSKRLEEVEERLGEARDSVQIVLDQWTLLKRLETDIPKRRDSIATKGDDSGYDLSEDEIWSVRTGLSERPFSDIDWSVLTPLPRPSQFSAELVVAEDDPGMGKGIQSAPDNRAFAHVNLKVVEPFQGPELAFHPELGSSGWPADPADSRAQSPSWQDLKDKVLETGSNRFPHVAVWPYWKSTQDDKVVWRRAAAPFHLSLAFCEIRISRNWLLGGVKIKSKSGDLEGPF
ncbi:MAG: protein kinase domain-containing protein, partial [Limisphaerales bacterium]